MNVVCVCIYMYIYICVCVQNGIVDQTIVKGGTDGYTNFLRTYGDTDTHAANYMQHFFWNCTNLEDVLASNVVKPQFERVGPYTYQFCAVLSGSGGGCVSVCKIFLFCTFAGGALQLYRAVFLAAFAASLNGSSGVACGRHFLPSGRLTSSCVRLVAVTTQEESGSHPRTVAE